MIAPNEKVARKRPDALTLWRNQHLSYARLGKLLEYHEKSIVKITQQLGFKRKAGRTARFIEGPCVNCGTRCNAQELSSDFICAKCRGEHAPGCDCVPCSVKRDYKGMLEAAIARRQGLLSKKKFRDGAGLIIGTRVSLYY